MKLRWQDCLGNKPFIYARKVLKECRLKIPPICEKTVSDYLGLEIKEFPVDGVSLTDDLLEIFKTSCAWLKRTGKGRPCIWVYRQTRLGRKRLSIFHECGHAILPWHEDLDYFCNEDDLDPFVHNRIEREAFGCGSEFLMPRELFVEDALSLGTCFSAIEQLHHRYLASLEATAIWYAFTHPGLCGILMVEPWDSKKVEVASLPACIPRGQEIFPFKEYPKPVDPEGHERYPLKVKYFVKSHRFPKYIRPGAAIGEGSLIFDAWASGIPQHGEIPVSLFGSMERWALESECIPLGKSGRILALLWLPDHQLKVQYNDGVIL